MVLRETASFWNGQLNIRELIPDHATWLDRLESMSAVADRLGEPARVPLAPPQCEPSLLRTATGRPTHRLVFLHGGGWMFYNASVHSFVAETALAARAAFFNVGYRKLPKVRMADAVADAVAAVNAASAGAERVVLVGHCAGAHLAVEAAFRAARRPEAIVAASGIYDLAPMRYSPMQEMLDLTQEEVASFSPIGRAGEIGCPLHLFVGADETVEYRRQTVRMYEEVQAAGAPATISILPQRHHVSMVADLGEPRSLLSCAVQRLLA